MLENRSPVLCVCACVGRESKYQQLDLKSCMVATGETEGNKTVSKWNGTRGQRSMSLRARPHEQPSVGGTLGVFLSCQRHSEVWVSLGARPAGVGMRETACTSSWSRAVASGAHMSSCQQLGRLGSGATAEQTGCVSPAAGSTLYTSILVHPSCSAREGSRVILLVLCLGNCSVCLGGLCSWPWCVVHTCALYGC